MPQPTIRDLTLYKQGIGYFIRRGEVEDRTISLVIPREATNDVLKSLNVIVHSGGQVLGVDYETPEDKAQVLSELSVKIASRSSLVDLLTSLRGAQVTLRLGDDLTATGRLVGVEASLDPANHPSTLVLQTGGDSHDLQVWPVTQIRGLTLLDDRAATDVDFFLDVSQTEQTRATLTIRLSEGNHDLEISYLAPSPTWRVSYRLISDGDGQARFIGWGLFDNSLDEDLQEVSLTLVSGRPISFEYGLYESRVPSRPQVSDDPMGLESATADPLLMESLSALSHELRTPLSAMVSSAQLLDRVGSLTPEQRKFVEIIRQGAERMNNLMNNLLDMVRLREKDDESGGRTTAAIYRSGPLGDLKVSRGYFMPVMMSNAEPEFMMYEVKTPVSVRRGQSAMVPIIDASIQYEELCVYNGDKMPNHPLLVWRFQNTSGVALEQGPVTLVKEARYVGEGLLRFAGVGDDIQIPYAIEFAILVTEKTEWGEKELLSVEFDAEQRQAVVNRFQITEYTYTLSSRVSRAMTVLIERRDPNRGEYFEMPTPDFALAGHTRWSVFVPASGEAVFTIRVRNVYDSNEDASAWQEDWIEELHEIGLLPDTKYTTLKNLLDEKQQAADAAEEIKTLQADYNQLVGLQEQLRKNLNALGESEREVTIRNRILDDLESSEDRRRQIESLLTSLNTQIKQHQINQETLIDQLYAASE